VTTLMGMQSAAGLFHRASVQSGGGGNFQGADMARETARQLMKELKLGPKDLAALQKVDWATLNAASTAAAARVNPTPANAGGPGGPPTSTPRAGIGPCVDGRIITVRSFYDVAPELSKNIPMLIGNVSEEGNRMNSRPTEAQWKETLSRTYGESKAAALIAAMKKAHPEKSIRTLSYGVNGLTSRNNVQRMVKLKCEQKGAPVYQYFFTWQSPMLEDAGAWHTAELAFCFDNTKRCEQGTGNTPEAQALAKKMATAWVNFARTGNPSQPGLTWTPSDPAKCQTMVFDNRCRMVDDPEGEVRRILLG
jgi:para-nitrobenzyl esterase